MAKDDDLEKIARDLGLSNITRHIFLCADQTQPKCCSREAGLASWEYLKKRLAELNLSQNGSIYHHKSTSNFILPSVVEI